MGTIFSSLKTFVHGRALVTSHAEVFWMRFVLNGSAALGLLLVVLASFITSHRTGVSVLEDITAHEFDLYLMPDDKLPQWRNLAVDIEDPIIGNTIPATYCRHGRISFNDRIATGDHNIFMKIKALTSGDVKILLPDFTMNEGIGELRCDTGDPMPDIAKLSIVIPAKINWTGVIEGRFVFGNVAQQQVSDVGDFNFKGPEILAGTLVTEVSSLPDPSGTIRTTTELYPGDALTLHSQGRPSLTYATLEKTADGIRLVGRATAEDIALTTAGSKAPQQIYLTPPIWQRFQAQSEWIILLSFLVLFNGILTAYEQYCRSVWSDHEAKATDMKTYKQVME